MPISVYKNKSDLEIWDEIKTGEKAAFDFIFYEYANSLIKYGESITKDILLIEDCLQETFIEIWQKKERLKLHSSIKFYLITAFRRKLQKKLPQSNKWVVTSDITTNSLSDFASSSEDQLIDGELSDKRSLLVKEAIENLSARQKESIYLKYYQNLSFQEVADTMSITTKSAYKLLAKAIENLEKGLISSGYFDLFTTSIILFSFFLNK
ncbi:sigma-70 family RNA polymerase sigma factor [Flammeovirgaceae bacterium SG7u.111]|nr:sigma-70 family RNA polymerase sigma factor [Flammeovirgaceae bacterium SG7u.132]WPO36832.1 sigma-70 family RNA polymerase sigma factor [Flammeovirgaceae bacterium SG7u.111]